MATLQITSNRCMAFPFGEVREVLYVLLKEQQQQKQMVPWKAIKYGLVLGCVIAFIFYMLGYIYKMLIFGPIRCGQWILGKPINGSLHCDAKHWGYQWAKHMVCHQVLVFSMAFSYDENDDEPIFCDKGCWICCMMTGILCSMFPSNDGLWKTVQRTTILTTIIMLRPIS